MVEPTALTALGALQSLLAIIVLFPCSMQACLAFTTNISKSFVHKANFVSAMLFTIMTADIHGCYGIYPWQFLAICWTLAKALVCTAVVVVFFHILEAGSKLRGQKSLSYSSKRNIFVCTSLTFCVQACELSASLISGPVGVGGGPFTALDLFLISLYAIASVRPLRYLRDQQQATIEMVNSTSKEMIHSRVRNTAIFKALIRKLNVLISMCKCIAVGAFVLGCAVVAVMSYEHSSAIGLYKGQTRSYTNVSLEAACFVGFGFITLWLVYYSWTPIRRRTNRRTSLSLKRNVSRSKSRLSANAYPKFAPSHSNPSLISSIRYNSSVDGKEFYVDGRKLSMSIDGRRDRRMSFSEAKRYLENTRANRTLSLSTRGKRAAARLPSRRPFEENKSQSLHQSRNMKPKIRIHDSHREQSPAMNWFFRSNTQANITSNSSASALTPVFTGGHPTSFATPTRVLPPATATKTATPSPTKAHHLAMRSPSPTKEIAASPTRATRIMPRQISPSDERPMNNMYSSNSRLGIVTF